jgi:hypothetical protein
MSATPSPPGTKDEGLDEETERTLIERLKTIDKDEKDSIDAREALTEIRKNLRHPRPR